jgi:hypothetical protein
VTTINAENVDISWTAPFDQGSVITQYLVQIRSSDDTTYFTDATNCDGSKSTVIDSLMCSIPIATLRLAPFSLAWGSHVWVKVTATNAYGSSEEDSYKS